MLLATLALSIVQPVMAQLSLLQSLADAPAAAAQAPCNPDPMKSLGCVAHRYEPARRTEAKAPMICNHDPLKGAACHAHVAHSKAEQWAEKRSDEQLATTAD
ncbi:MAG: hypothetical protein ACKVOL_11805 [Novosphingobium sp.]